MQAVVAHPLMHPIAPNAGETLVRLCADLSDLGPQHSRRDITLVGAASEGVVVRADRYGYEIHVGCVGAARLVRRITDSGCAQASPLTNFQRAVLAACVSWSSRPSRLAARQ